MLLVRVQLLRQKYGVLAQLVRAPTLRVEGRRFDSDMPHIIWEFSSVEEHLPYMQDFGGSIPSILTMTH